ncbi:MAG TPA: carboxypeptidase-like regulatory domain-containing protein [Candidatus Acidoferrum sp.]
MNRRLMIFGGKVKMKKWMAFLLRAWVIALLIPSGLRAQAGATGAITGTVLDEKGGAISGATIVIINQATGKEERSVTSTSAGIFNVPSLPPGHYRLEVAATGFTKVILENVLVQVTETASVTATLPVGQVTESVVVHDVATTVELTSATTGETISAETASTLPLSTRNFLTLLTLSAGANTELFDSAALGRGQVTINVNGQRPTNNNFQLEGVNANDVNLPILDNVPLPNPDTIEEFKTQTSLYDASSGRNGGGNVQVNLKSGTAHYHGDAYEFFRNNVLNANDFFFNAATPEIPRPVLRQNQYGGSFGGPVPKSKDFFFFVNYQGTREQSGISAGTVLNSQIPVLPKSRDAATLAATFLPPGFSASQINPVALAYLNLPASKCPLFNDGTFCIPAVTGTPGFNGQSVNLGTVTATSVGTFQDDQFVLTADKQLTSKDKLSARWFFSDNGTTQPFGTTPSVASANANNLPFAQDLPGSNRFLKLGWTRVFSGNVVNDARFGFSRFFFAQDPSEPITLADIGATRPNSAEFPAAYQLIITGGGPLVIGTGVNDNRGGAFNTFYGADDLSITKGKHLIRFGFDASRYQLNRFNNFAQRGSVTFADTPAGDASPGFPNPPALSGFQNFLLGRVDTTQAEAGFSTFHFRALDFSGYVQDDWKIKPRLTLNLGLRWEGLSTAHELNNFLSNFRGLEDGQPGPISIIHPAGTKNVGTPGVSSCTLVNCFSAGNFAPRVSYAWDIFGNQKTVIRSGYGIYYQRVSNQSLLQTAGGLPFSEAVSAQQFSVTPQNPFPNLLPNSAFPLPTDQVVPALIAFDGTTGAPIFRSADGGPLSGFFFFPIRSFRPPYAQQWNFNVQRDLGMGWLLEVGYVGTRGSHLLGTGRPANPGQICTITEPCVIPASIGANVDVPAGTPFVTKNPDGTIEITASTAANLNARVPTQYLGLANSRGFFQFQDGSSTYHGLQTTLSHHFTGSLYFQAAYTYSKSIDNGSGSVFGDELNGLIQYGNLLEPNGQRAVSDFDRTHRFVVSYNYDLPVARSLRGRGPTRLVNGWAVNGVSTFQSGTPVTLFDSSALTLQDLEGVNGTNFATLAPGATLASAIPSGGVESRLGSFLNLNAFVPGGNCVNNQNVVVPCQLNGQPNRAVAGAAIGNVGRNTFRGPFQQNWDLSITKNTKVTEATSVDFRAEFFNAFNHPVFSGPQSGGFGSTGGNLGLVNIANGSSSILSTANRPRIIQFAMKFNF